MLAPRRQTDIHHIAIEAPGPSSWRERYETLEDSLRIPSTPDQRGYWLRSTYPEEDRSEFSGPQLLHLLAKAEFAPDEARNAYLSGPWGEFHTLFKHTDTQDQLLAVMLQRRLGLPEAAANLAFLKSTGLFNADQVEWQPSYAFGRRAAPRSADQLLGVLAEDLGEDESRHRYIELKKRGFYDAERERWRETPASETDDETDEAATYPVGTQIFGILVELRFDPEGARKRFAALRSEYSHPTSGRWFWCAGGPDAFISELELPAMLVEMDLERNELSRRDEAISSLPKLLDIR